MYFYYLPYIILRKWLRWFDEKNAISPRLLCYATVILAFPPLHKKANKVLQEGVSLPFIGSLRV